MNKAAVVETVSYFVINIIMADAEKDPAPEGCILVDITDRDCAIGWIYDPATDTFIIPPEWQPEEVTV